MDAPSSICTEGPAPGAAGGIVAFSIPKSRHALLEPRGVSRGGSADPRGFGGPLESAWRLHKNWRSSELHIVDDAGHGGGSMPAILIATLNCLDGG
jgi:hypothetical protein